MGTGRVRGSSACCSARCARPRPTKASKTQLVRVRVRIRVRVRVRAAADPGVEDPSG